jgi:hypothetical protein
VPTIGAATLHGMALLAAIFSFDQPAKSSNNFLAARVSRLHPISRCPASLVIPET